MKKREVNQAHRVDVPKKNKRCIHLIRLTVLTLLFALVFSLVGSRSRADGMLADAEAYLSANPYKLVLSTEESSTDSVINESLNKGSSKVALMVDADDFGYTEFLGDGSITYYCIGDTLYIDESVVNVCTKSKLTEDEKNKLRDQYITEFTAEDYKSADIDKDKGGNKIIIFKNPTDEKIAELEKPFKSGESSADASVCLDLKETKVIVVLDEQGRYKSIEQIYAFSVDYTDGYSALILMEAKKEYTYENIGKLGVPAGTYMDSSNAYKDLFDASFEVTTNVVTSTNNKEILNRLNLISSVFGNVSHNILRVDGNNFECTYPNTNQPAEGETAADGITEKWTLFGDTLYLDYTNVKDGESVTEKIKQDIDDDIRRYIYRANVIDNLFPSYARDYLSITKEASADGSVTVTCKGITENIYNSLVNLLNTDYMMGMSSVVLIPNVDKCTYIVKYDEYGRFLSTKLTFSVSVTDAVSGMEYSDEMMMVERKFDYEAAEDYYESVGEALDPWITAPSDADKYTDGIIY